MAVVCPGPVIHAKLLEDCKQQSGSEQQVAIKRVLCAALADSQTVSETVVQGDWMASWPQGNYAQYLYIAAQACSRWHIALPQSRASLQQGYPNLVCKAICLLQKGARFETLHWHAGPGVGKGRQIASLVFENLLRGRKKVRGMPVQCMTLFCSQITHPRSSRPAQSKLLYMPDMIRCFCTGCLAFGLS